MIIAAWLSALKTLGTKLDDVGVLASTRFGTVMSGRRPLIKGFFRRCAGRGCGHVFGLVRGELDPLALMLSADPLPPSRERA
jgi:hypothetical protein